jgi:hypothetical protein
MATDAPETRARRRSHAATPLDGLGAGCSLAVGRAARAAAEGWVEVDGGGDGDGGVTVTSCWVEFDPPAFETVSVMVYVFWVAVLYVWLGCFLFAPLLVDPSPQSQA